MAYKRKKLNKKYSKKIFSKTAKRTHGKNLMGNSGSAMAMRGGIRL